MNLDLAELKKRLQPRSLLSLTIEFSRLACVVVGRGEGFAQSAALPAGAEEVLKDPERVGSELRAALAEACIRERRCAVRVPPSWALTASTDVPEVGDDDWRGYLELRAEREFSIPASDLRFGFSTYQAPDGTRRATLAAISAKRIEAVEKMLETAGCRAVSISLALDGCLGAEPMLHLLAAEDHVDVALTAGGGIAGLRTLSLIAPFDPESFCREIRITLGRLPEGLRKQITRARFGGAREIAETLRFATGAGLERMGLECDLEDGNATAAAERVLRREDAPFEFVVPHTNRFEEIFQRFDSKRRRGFAAAAGGVFLLLILTLLIRSHIESSLESEWDNMKGNVAEVDALQQKIRRFRPWFETSPQGVQVLESLIAAFPESGDVWAKSIQIGENYKITCTGFARTHAAWLALLDKLRARPDVTALQVQQLRGDNPVQFAITYKWEQKHEG